MREDPGRLDELARKNGSVAAVDCGVAPGLSHMLVSRMVAQVRKPDTLEVLVGGLPRVRRWPFEYVSVFSPRDVVEEYLRPARIKEAGKVVEKPALSEVELVEFEEIGTLEAFLTDGLRSLLDTLDIPNMKEKTMRYPGHAEKMRMLRDTGFFSEEFIEVSGQQVRPLDVAARILERAWRTRPGELDLTALRMVLTGADSDGKPVRLSCEMVDVVEDPKGFTSMARTTGYTCTAVARALLSDAWKEPGVVFPEQLGKSEPLLDRVLNDLDQRGLTVKFVPPA
jgi:saccharopine dehydrogenase-like NADP-dependent oxidoreductase